MTGLHYPDNLYADHEERKARRSQQPTGAYDSRGAGSPPWRPGQGFVVQPPAIPELSESERKLRTALAYVNHARDLIRDALGDNSSSLHDVNRAAMCQPERVPKWDPAWGKPPNCDGLSARDVRAPHPMASEVIRDHDERLSGGEDRL